MGVSSLRHRAPVISVRRWLTAGLFTLALPWGLASCSDEPAGGGPVASLDGANAGGFALADNGNLDGKTPLRESDAPLIETPAPRASLVTSVAGAGTVSSESFRLTLSVGAPVMSPVTMSPNYRLQIYTLLPQEPSEVP